MAWGYIKTSSVSRYSGNKAVIKFDNQKSMQIWWHGITTNSCSLVKVVWAALLFSYSLTYMPVSAISGLLAEDGDWTHRDNKVPAVSVIN